MTDNELAVMIGAMKDVLSILADAYAREDVPYAVRVTMADAWGKLAPFVDMHKEPKASMEMICSYCADWFNPGDVTVPARAIGSPIDGQTIHAACQEQRDFANGVSDLPAQGRAPE